MPIPLFDTATPLEPLRETILARIAEVVAETRFILGPNVQAFEQEFAEYLGVRHVIGVANGTDAITVALRAMGVKPGDEVVVPALTFYASAEAVVNAGARPVFCDVDHDTRNVTADTVRAVLTPRTRAIVSVDLFGLPAPDLRELGSASPGPDVARRMVERGLNIIASIEALPYPTVAAIEGVVGNAESVSGDSFYDGLLDYPHYTRPEEMRGRRVPDVLLSGHHENIRKWRKEQALRATLKKRPDLLETADLDDEAREVLRRIENET